MQFSSVLWVALGGSLGATSRYLLGLWLNNVFPHYPAGTLAVNLLGSGCAGVLLGLSLYLSPPPPAFMLIVMTGFLGSFTTFSAFGYETHALLLQGSAPRALTHIAANVLGSLSMVTGGLFLVKLLRALWLK